MTTAQMEFQCLKYLEWIKKGDLDGIIFCSNTLADIGIESADWLKTWISQVGDEEV